MSNYMCESNNWRLDGEKGGKERDGCLMPNAQFHNLAQGRGFEVKMQKCRPSEALLPDLVAGAQFAN